MPFVALGGDGYLGRPTATLLSVRGPEAGSPDSA
jgi:hypothetical protein